MQSSSSRQAKPSRNERTVTSHVCLVFALEIKLKTPYFTPRQKWRDFYQPAKVGLPLLIHCKSILFSHKILTLILTEFHVEKYFDG